MSIRSRVSGRISALLAAALFAVGLSAVSCSQAAGSAKAAANCVPNSGKTLAQANGVRVFVLDPPKGFAYACLLSTGTTRRLGYASGFHGKPGVIGRPKSLGLRAPAVAASLLDYGLDFATLSLQSVNLLSEATTRCELGGALAPHRAPAITQTLIARGNLPVWIAKPNGGYLNGSREKQVAYCQAGKVTVLDSGEAINLRSLRLEGRFVSWEVGGVRQIAPLP
jgi:hypothetical protein